jgi:hypothetical protein
LGVDFGILNLDVVEESRVSRMPILNPPRQLVDPETREEKTKLNLG